jgi:DNA gyrase/topoisomerase IV subunit B
MAVKQSNAKEIIALNTFEAVRLRPTMYIGQVAPLEDKLPIIVDGKLNSKEKNLVSRLYAFTCRNTGKCAR